MTMHDISWFVLIGWVTGWVTGRSLKHTGYGAFGDAFLGVAGGLVGGWLLRHSGIHSHWGFLLAAIGCTAGAVALTWLVRRVIQRQTIHSQQHASI